MISSTLPKNFSPTCKVAACYIEHDWELLFLKRSKNVRYSHTWCTPGWKVESWEHFTGAAIREVFEETGIELDISNIQFLEKVYVQHKDHDIIYYTHIYKIDTKPHVILTPNEHEDFCWMSPEQALKTNLIEDEDLCVKKFFKL